MSGTSCYQCKNTKAAVLNSGLCYPCQRAAEDYFEIAIDNIPGEARRERELFIETRPRLRIEEK
jgi:hypothetical protein